MADMLVNLYNLPPLIESVGRPDGSVRVVRAHPADKRRVLRFVESNVAEHWPDESADNWLGETEAALANHPPTVFIAVQERSIVGFACYDATAKGYFGPTGVVTNLHRTGVGRTLLLSALHAMRGDGYGYAIIGWPSKAAVGFYEHTVNAWLIPPSGPNLYERMIES